MSRRRVVAEVLLFAILLFALAIRLDLLALLRNRTALALVRWSVSNGVSVVDLGLYLEYSDVLWGSTSRIASWLPAVCKSMDPRLAVYVGIIHLTDGDFDESSRCLSWALASRPGLPDAEILLVSSYHLAGRPMDSLRAFEQLPKEAQSIPAVAAQALSDYAVVSSSDAALILPGSFRSIIPRAVLFELLDSHPGIAPKFLEKAAAVGLFSPLDRSDFDSIVAWLARDGRSEASGVEGSRSLRSNAQLSRLRSTVARALGCSQENVDFGPNMMGEPFDGPQSLAKWRDLPWTSGAASTYNAGGFKWGWDVIPEDANVGAMRISGLWKKEDLSRYPASVGLQFVAPLHLQSGNSLYLMYVRYKTENVRAGQITIWFDSADYRRFGGVWSLESAENGWHEMYALGSVDSSQSPISNPMISYSALGTVWINDLQVRPVYLNDCSFPGTKIVGTVSGE